MAKEQNAKEVFARVLTYLVLFMSAVFLVLTLFIENIVKVGVGGRHLIHPDYWGGLGIVPIVLLGYVFLGISTNLSAGIYIEKKTRYLPSISFVGATVNVAANYILIPRFGMLGAAWATLLAYLVMTIGLYFVVQRVYPIRYELERLARIAAATTIVVASYYAIRTVDFAGDSGLALDLLKVALLILFVGLMYLMKFFEPREISTLKRIATGIAVSEQVSLEGEEHLEDHGVSG